MSKTTMTAAFALLMAASLPVYAQSTTTTTPPASGSSAAAPAKTNATHIQPGQIRTTEMDGATVYDTQNNKVGDVKDIILDRDGKVASVVLDVGAFLGMGGKYVAVPLKDIKMDNNRLTLDMTKEQLKSAQAFKFNETESTGTSKPPSDRNHNR